MIEYDSECLTESNEKLILTEYWELSVGWSRSARVKSFFLLLLTRFYVTVKVRNTKYKGIAHLLVKTPKLTEVEPKENKPTIWYTLTFL